MTAPTSLPARVVMIDGAIVAPDAAKVSVYDRGFLYGDSVFEVLRAYAGVPFALEEHVDRLAASASLVLIPLPVSTAVLADEITAAIRAAPSGVDVYVRVVVTRGTGPLGLDLALAAHPTRVVLVEPLPALPRALYARGVTLASITTTRAVEGTAAVAAKYGSYLANMLAMHEAKGRGAADALLVDASGRVLEGTTSNVFAVRGRRLVTPPLRAGILGGITRGKVLALARARGMDTDDLGDLDVDALASADEVFLTSSIRELVPVTAIDGRSIGRAEPGPVTRELHRALRSAAGAVEGPMPWEERAGGEPTPP